MQRTSDDKSLTTPRLWCIAATAAPIVAVIARCYGEQQWTCILRWNWETQTVEEGAWTTMSISAHRCALSPDGEFLYYHAKGPVGGPFDSSYGGAYAVSRLPWLSALTNTDTFGPAGGWPSRDALSDADQKRLWKIFDESPWYLLDEFWPQHLGPGWRRLDPEQVSLPRTGTPDRLVATSPLLDAGLLLVASVARRDKWSVWGGDLSYSLVKEATPSEVRVPLPEVRFAHPVAGGRLLAATSDAKLRVLRYRHRDELSQEPRIEFEHALSTLFPNPGPSPGWAKAALSRQDRLPAWLRKLI